MKKYKPQVSIYQKPTANVNDTVTFPPLPVETPWECKCGGSGSGGGDVFLIGATTSGSTTTLDKTWAEIKAAAESGLLPVGMEIGEGSVYFYIFSRVYGDSGDYIAATVDSTSFIANAESGYPAYSEGGII